MCAPSSLAERVAYLKSHLDPDSPKVGSSGVQTDAMNRAAGEAQSTLQNDSTGDFDDERWRQVQAASNEYKAQHTPQDNGQAGAGLSEDEDHMWQSALSRFQQESSNQLNGAGNGSSSSSDDSNFDADGKAQESLSTMMSNRIPSQRRL